MLGSFLSGQLGVTKDWVGSLPGHESLLGGFDVVGVAAPGLQGRRLQGAPIGEAERPGPGHSNTTVSGCPC